MVVFLCSMWADRLRLVFPYLVIDSFGKAKDTLVDEILNMLKHVQSVNISFD